MLNISHFLITKLFKINFPNYKNFKIKFSKFSFQNLSIRIISDDLKFIGYTQIQEIFHNLQSFKDNKKII